MRPAKQAHASIISGGPKKGGEESPAERAGSGRESGVLTEILLRSGDAATPKLKVANPAVPVALREPG
jgi:hypothetical protein